MRALSSFSKHHSVGLMLALNLNILTFMNSQCIMSWNWLSRLSLKMAENGNCFQSKYNYTKHALKIMHLLIDWLIFFSVTLHPVYCRSGPSIAMSILRNVVDLNPQFIWWRCQCSTQFAWNTCIIWVKFESNYLYYSAT